MAEEFNRLLQQAAAELKAAGARQVYVFGSAAKGNLRQDSDVDLAVSGLPPQTYFDVLARISRIFHRSVDLIDLDEETPFALYLKSEGELQRVA